MIQRKNFFIIAKILFAATALFFLFHKVNMFQLWTSIKNAHPIPIFLGTLLCWSTILIATWRWQQLLKLFEIEIPFWSLFCMTQIGQFFLMFLPGPTGDDMTRMLYISRFSKEKKGESCVSVLIDRAIGLAAVLIVALFCVPWQWTMLSVSPQTHYLAILILSSGSFAALLGILFFLFAHPSHYWFEHSLKFFRKFSLQDEISRIAGLVCIQKRIIFRVGIAAITTQLLLCAMFYLAGKATGIQIPFVLWLSFVPIILASNAIPITMAGIGIREYLMVLFLGVLGSIHSEQALAASLLAFAMTLAVCLLGGIIYIFYRPAISTREAMQPTS